MSYFFNLIFLVLGIILGYFLNKEKIKEVGSNIKVRSLFIKPDGRVIDSKEVNSLNKESDDINYQHNDYFDNEQR